MIEKPKESLSNSEITDIAIELIRWIHIEVGDFNRNTKSAGDAASVATAIVRMHNNIDSWVGDALRQLQTKGKP